jgi:hypothetical protein
LAFLVLGPLSNANLFGMQRASVGSIPRAQNSRFCTEVG